jgi:uncharacterized protein
LILSRGEGLEISDFRFAFRRPELEEKSQNRQTEIIDGPLHCRKMASIMLAKDLLEILVCPADKQPLEYRENPESLKCTQCHRVYAVKDNIPIMLIDEATVEP